MPTTENDRLNRQEPVLQNPSLPDHDRTKDEGMHAAIPEEMNTEATVDIDADLIGDEDITPPDQEFEQILSSGTVSNHGRIPEDPNNWLTSDAEKGVQDLDPEARGESLVDILDGDKH